MTCMRQLREPIPDDMGYRLSQQVLVYQVGRSSLNFEFVRTRDF
jgi:hypothetical protein